MVFSIDARIDVDNELLTKNIIYRRKNINLIDLATEENDIEDYTDFNIKAQCTIQRFDSKYVSAGILLEGDLVGLFRYKYEKDCDGFIIMPVLVPKTKDLIKFAGQWFSIKQCTPATNEDAGIIGWDFTAGQITINDYELEENVGC
jgi:hypothetical protein